MNSRMRAFQVQASARSLCCGRLSTRTLSSNRLAELRLKDVVIDQKQLYLIFEYVERDLKSYLESLGNKFMDAYKVKVFAAANLENHLSNIIGDRRLSR